MLGTPGHHHIHPKSLLPLFVTLFLPHWLKTLVSTFESVSDPTLEMERLA